MGGFGSGRKQTRTLVSDLRRLNANELQRLGALKKSAPRQWTWKEQDRLTAQVTSTYDGSTLRLDYSFREGETWKKFQQQVRIVWQPCPFGGRRAYFRCPNEGCSRNCYILYGNDAFICRTCRRIAYLLQRLAPNQRALARAQQLRLALGGNVDVSSPLPPRPPGMHAWTHTRRNLQILAAERKANEVLIAAFGGSLKQEPQPTFSFEGDS